jgi:hypothetical protein
MAFVTHEKLEIPTSLANLYQEMAVSPIMLLKNYALTHIYTMIQKYEVENTYFEKKYGCTFQEFKTKVERMENEENFEWEDDLMDWEFAVENLVVWKHKAEEVEN